MLITLITLFEILVWYVDIGQDNVMMRVQLPFNKIPGSIPDVHQLPAGVLGRDACSSRPPPSLEPTLVQLWTRASATGLQGSRSYLNRVHLKDPLGAGPANVSMSCSSEDLISRSLWYSALFMRGHHDGG